MTVVQKMQYEMSRIYDNKLDCTEVSSDEWLQHEIIHGAI